MTTEDERADPRTPDAQPDDPPGRNGSIQVKVFKWRFWIPKGNTQEAHHHAQAKRRSNNNK